MKSIAIIPARGGSKRLPRKNIKEFCGFPIIKYSIDAAIKSGCFDKVMVSTDDEEIANVAKKYGAEVPFYRSKENSNDYAGTEDVIREVLGSYKKIGLEFEYSCCIYATAPFVTEGSLREAYELLKNDNIDGVFPVVKFGYPIQRALRVVNNRIQMVWPENEDKRSQDLEESYHDVGQFYWVNTKTFLSKGKIFTDNTMGLVIPEIKAQDIDTEQDWKIAEVKYRTLFPNNKNA